MGCLHKKEVGFDQERFLVSVPHPKGGNIVCTCVKDNIIQERDNYETIGLSGFCYKLFEEEELGWFQDRLDGYTDLEHPIQLLPGVWVNQMGK